MGLIKYPWKKHLLTPYALWLFCYFSRLHVHSWRSFSWKRLDFSNPLGLEVEVDKKAQNILNWWKLGAGFLEMGPVTPGSYSKKATFSHSPSDYKFNPSFLSAENLKKNLKRYTRPYPTPIFLNLGATTEASLEKVSENYKVLVRQLVDHTDVFVISLSSSNIKELGVLQSKKHFKDFLGPILDTIKAQEYVRPTLLKLGPDDESNELFISNIETSKELGIDGWVLTSATESISFSKGRKHQDLKKYSEHRLHLTTNYLGKQKEDYLIVSAGDLTTPKDVEEKLSKGANLVQVDTAHILKHPCFFKKVANSFQHNF